MMLTYARRLLQYHRRLWALAWAVLFVATLAPLSVELAKEGIDRSIEGRLQELLGSDLVVSSRRKLNAPSITAQAQATQNLEVVSLYSMIKTTHKNPLRLAHLSFIPRGFPHYGEVAPPDLQEAFHTKPMAYVTPELWESLQVSGPSIVIGGQTFHVQGPAPRAPGALAPGQSMAPKVFLSQSHLGPMKLLSKGSTVRFSYHLVLEESHVPTAKEALKQHFHHDPSISVQDGKDNALAISRVVRAIEGFMGPASFMSFLLALVAMCFILHKIFVRETPHLTSLQLMGIPQRNIFGAYLLAFLPVVATALAVGLATSWGLAPWVSSLLKERFALSLSPPSWARGGLLWAIGLVSTLTFYLPMATKRPSLWGLPLAWSLWIALALTPSSRLLVGQLTGLVAMATMAGLVVWASCFFLQKLTSKNLPPVLCLSIWQLARFPRHTLASVVLLALPLGAVGLVDFLSKALEKELAFSEHSTPGLFLFDILPKQKIPLKDMVAQHGGSVQKLSPWVKARMVGINGQAPQDIPTAMGPVEREHRKARIHRGVNLSYQEALSDSESIVEGEDFFGDPPGLEFGLSVEHRHAALWGIEVGDLVAFEVLGETIQGRVKNLRRIRWQSFDPNFFMVFQKEALAHAPHTWVASLELPSQNIRNFRHKLLSLYPNISSIDVRQIIGQVTELVARVRGLLHGLGAGLVLLGATIFAGLLSVHWEDRRADLISLRWLGARKQQGRAIMGLELMFILSISLFCAWGFQQAVGAWILKKIF